MLLETKRLRLRKFESSDLDDIHALDNDPEVMRHINGGIETPREVIEYEIMPLFLTYDDARPGIGFWVGETGSREFIGWFCLRDTGAEGEASIGYRLRRSAWGKGLATEGARALADFGFERLGLARIIATTYEDNIGSCRVLEKLGFTLVRRFKLDLNEQQTAHFDSVEPWEGDDLEYAVTRNEWRAVLEAPR